MDVETVRSRAGGAVRLLAASAALAAPPALLATVVGNPLPAFPIDWSKVVESIQAGLVPSSVWVNVLSVVAWATWVVLVGMLAIEGVAVARHRPSAPSTPEWIRRTAQVLVAAAFAVAGPGAQPVAAGAAGASAFIVAAAPANHSGTAQAVEVEEPAVGRLVTVGEGDSWGGFADHVLGDASLGPQLRAANVGRGVGAGHTVTEATAFVEPGWRLLIPTDLDGSLSGATRQANADPGLEAEAPAARSWDVAEGDHFWGIAKTTLTESWGRAPTDEEITPYWRQLVEANTDRLLPPEDPNLIYPGQSFELPAPPTDPTAGSRDEDAPSMDAPEERTAQDGWRGAIEGLGPPPSPDRGESAAADGWRAAIESRDVPAGEDVAQDDAEGEDRTALGAPQGLTAGAAAASLMAAGIVATIRWRRRTALQQRGPGMRLPTPLPQVDDEVATLEAAAADDQPLNDLGSLLLSIPADVHPVLVRAADHGEVVVYFDETQTLPEPPTPWTLAEDGTDGPVGWRAQLGDRGPERSFGLPLLVTLGRTGASTLLANIGAMGILAVEGPPAEERRRLRAMGLEVATSRISVPVEVAVAGDDRLASLDQVRHIDDPTAEVQMAMDEVAQDIVIDDRTPRLLVCHHDIDPPDVPADLTGMVGVAVAGTAASSPWVLVIEDEHFGRLRLPDGGTVQLVLPDINPELIDDELTRLDEGPVVALPDLEAAPASEPGSQSADPSTNGHRAPESGRATEPAWCEVQILGPVAVVRNGERVDLPPRVLELLVYLVLHPGGVPKGRLDNVLWAGHDPGGRSQRVTSALTKLRKRLGEGPDGELLAPRRQGDEPIELSPHVGCDLDRALAHLAVAKDLPADLAARELAAALELVRGEPFDGRAYSWATDADQRAIVQLQDAALEAARTLREAGDLDAADTAVAQGLKLLDPNGWLYFERAELERLRGHPEQPSRIFEIYRRKLVDDADEIAGVVASPPPEIELAFRELMARA